MRSAARFGAVGMQQKTPQASSPRGLPHSHQRPGCPLSDVLRVQVVLILGVLDQTTVADLCVPSAPSAGNKLVSLSRN